MSTSLSFISLHSTDIHIMEKTSSWRKNKNSIDVLPDEVLISIVSLLPTKESARTSVLARRWRHSWLHATSLTFDGSEMLHEICNRGKRIETDQTTLFGSQVVWIKQNMLQTERAAFVRSVNAALNSHLGKTLDELRVIFDLDSTNRDDIDRWIATALTKKVKRLELNLAGSCCIDKSHVKKYEFQNVVRNFETLVSLYLSEVNIKKGVLDTILCKCPFLEELCVRDSSGFQSLKPECKAIHLRSLAIEQCEGFSRLEICAPNLVSLTFLITRHDLITVSLNGVSSLIHLSLGARTPKLLFDRLIDISGSLSRLEMLTLRTATVGQGYGEMEFPNLPRLKTLVVMCNMMSDTHSWFSGSLLCFIPLLNAAPLLDKMVVKFTSRHVIKGSARLCYEGKRHKHLKVLEMEGLRYNAAIGVDMILYVLRNASSLEKMIIDGEVFSTGNNVGLNMLKLKLGSYRELEVF